MTGRDIQALRHRLGESVAEFADRWCVSARTVETWEQGLRHPHRLILRLMEQLASAQR